MNFVRQAVLIAAASLVMTLPACAQENPSARAADAITDVLIRRHIGVIADDSMLGRDTPSHGLEATANYIAANFKRLGLRPGGDGNNYLQRYQITRRKIDMAASTVRVQAGGTETTASFNRDARYLYGPRTGAPLSGPVVLIGGRIDSAFIATAQLEGKLVVFVGDYSRSMSRLNSLFVELLDARPRALLVVSNRDPALFDHLVHAQTLDEPTLETWADSETVSVEVQDRVFAAALSGAGMRLGDVRSSPRPILRALPGVQVSLAVRDVAGSNQSAPNVVGILEGTDPVLKHEYVVFSAHMDHVGVNASSTKDSIWNGADDDASGTAGVLSLAEAFTHAPPRRSLIFLTVSGEEKGLWGSEVFTTRPSVPMNEIVADLNLDMIGRNWKDTIVAIGKEHSDLGPTLDRVAAAHPELKMTPIDDLWPQESFYFRSDHYNFAKHGVPILFFFNGTHADYHAPSDSPDKIDAEKESRVVKLVYWLGVEVAMAQERPKWNPESYKRIVK
jgi:hypothetical protein